jgi:CheY-like chemotaxis protein
LPDNPVQVREGMADAKKVLVVDDHFEMLELLRSMLELSHDECEVLAVPSAEEGLLELRRTHFDLVITDIRLPGMSGFDLVRRIQKLGRDTPVIMITAYTSYEGQREADSLGVLHYFPKPLDTDAVLMAVQTALHGEMAAAVETADTYQVTAATAVSNSVRKRLQTLHTDTGATGLMLATIEGQILFEATSNRRLNFTKLAPVLVQTVRQSFALSQQLNSELPNTIQYHAGETIELYCANVGPNHFLTLFFDVQSRRGRIGTIWVFTQRAIKDLLEELAPAAAVPGTAREPAKTPAPPLPPPAKTAPPVEDALVQDEAIAAFAAVMIASQENGRSEPEETPATDDDRLVFDTSDLENLFDADLPEESLKADLDAFWENALSPDDKP